MTTTKIFGNKGGGKGGSSKSASEQPNTLQSQATARLIEIISHGECVGLADQANPLRSVFFDGVAAQNPDGSNNFKGITLQQRVGLPNQDPFIGFSEIESEHSISGQLIEFDTPRTYTVTSANVDAVRVRIQINGLTKEYKGGLIGSSVSYRIDRRVAAGAWSEVLTATINEKTTSQQQLSYRVDRPEIASDTDDWDIRVVRLTPDSITVTEQNSIELVGVTEITEAKLQYADLGAVALNIDSQQFGSGIPGRSYDWVGMVLDVPSNYSPPDWNDPNNTADRTYTGMWDGTFKRAWTDNPAWILWAMLTDREWGLGRVIDASQVDKWALYQIGQYCDEFVEDGLGGYEPRYTINTQISSSEEAYAILQSIASAFRGMIYWGSGSVTFVADKPSDPVKLVSAANVINGEFTYQGSSRKARHSVVKVVWNDPSDQYKAVPEFVEDADMIARFGQRITEVIAYGCTSKSQAIRMGRWILDTERYENEVVQYKASMDHADVRPGQIIQLHDEWYSGARTAGRFVSVSATSAVIDAPITLASGQTYTLTLTRPDGSLVERTLTNAAASGVTTLTWSSSLAQVQAASSPVILFTEGAATQRSTVAAITTTSVDLNTAVTLTAGVEYILHFTMPNGTVQSAAFTALASETTKELDWITALTGTPAVGSTVFLGVRDEGYEARTVSTATATSCTISSSVKLVAGYEYTALITLPDGSQRLRTLTNTPGPAITVLTWSESVSDLPIAGSMWGLSSAALEPRLFRVIGISEVEANIFEITALNYDPNKYDRVENGLILPEPVESIFQSEEVPLPPSDLIAYRRPSLQADGTYKDLITLTWTASESILVSHYRVSYKYESDAWVNLNAVFSNNVEFVSRGPGNYVFSVSAVNYLERESPAEIKGFELVDERPFDEATIVNLRLEGEPNVAQPSTIEFGGADLKIEWHVLPPANWIEDAEDWEDPFFRRYRVQFMTTAGSVISTMYTTDRRFVLTREQNTELNSGTPLRAFKIGIAIEDQQGNVGTEEVTTFENPAPAVPDSALVNTSTAIYLNFTRPTDLDHKGYLVWRDITTGFTPSSLNLVYYDEGVPVLDTFPGENWFIRYAAYDGFGEDGLNLSLEVSGTSPGISPGDLDTTPPAVPTGLALSTEILLGDDGTQTIMLNAEWDAVTDTDLSFYEISLQKGSDPTYEYATGGLRVQWQVEANTAYAVKVRAVDKVGNRSAWCTVETLTSAADTVPPAVPTSVVATAGLAACYIQWQNPADADLDAVEIYFNSVNDSSTAALLGESSALPSTPGMWTIAAQSPGTTIYLWLKARDTSGNRSSFTAVSSVTISKIDVNDFNTGLTPVEIFGTLPTTGNFDGRQVYLTTDKKLYRYDSVAAAFKASTAAADITGTITNAQIADMAATKLTGQIVSTQITDDAITTPKIFAGAVVTAKLAVGAVTAEKMTIGSMDNLIPNPDAEELNGPSAAFIYNVGAGYNGSHVYVMNQTASAYDALMMTDPFPAKAGDKFYVEAMVLTSVGTPDLGSVRMLFVLNDGSVVYPVDSRTNAPSTGWHKEYGYFTAPANTKLAQIYVEGNSTTGAYQLRFDALYARRRLTGEIIVDGTLTAAHIVAGSITGDRLTAGTITTGLLAAGSVTASKMTLIDNRNMLPDPDFLDASSWYKYSGGGWGISPSGNDPAVWGSDRLLYILSDAAATDILSLPFPVTPGDTLLTGGVQGIGPGAHPWEIYLIWYDSIAAANTGGYPAAHLIANGTGGWGTPWTHDQIVPTGKNFARWLFRRAGGDDGAVLYVSKPYVYRKNGASLIVDGSITATHIAAATITGDRMVAGTITATQLGADSVTAIKILAGAITTDKLNAGAVTADKLAIGTGSNMLNGASGALDPSQYMLRVDGSAATYILRRVSEVHGYTWSLPDNSTVLIQQQDATATSSAVFAFANYNPHLGDEIRYEVEPGKTYEFSLYGTSSGAGEEIGIYWFYEWGGYHSVSLSGTWSTHAGAGDTLDKYVRRAARGTAPAGCTWCRLYIVRPNTGSGWFMFTRPQFCETVPNATQMVPWAAAGVTYIDGRALRTGTVYADAIVAGTITGSKIAAGTITAGNIGASQITTDKMVVTGRGKALNQDPYCQDISAWGGTGGRSIVTITDGVAGGTCLRITGYDGSPVYDVRAFPVSNGLTYKFTTWVRKTSGTGVAYLRVYVLDAAGGLISYVVVGLTPTTGTFEGLTLSSSWTRYVGYFSTGAGAVAAYPSLFANWGGSGTTEFQDVRVEEYIGNDLIVDGTISATKIVTGSITATQIGAGAVTAGKISVSTLSSISANIGTITAGLLQNAAGTSFFDLDNSRIVFNNGAVMKVTGLGFGTSSQFLEWFGPTMALSSCSEANAIQYLKTNGDAYFGGSLAAGVLKNAATNTGLGTGEIIEIGPFGTNGDPKSIVASWTYNADVIRDTSATAGNTSSLACTIYIQKWVSGAWSTLTSLSTTGNGTFGQNAIGDSGSPNPGGGSLGVQDFECYFGHTVSVTFTDTDPGTADVKYRAYISRSGSMSFGGTAISGQSVFTAQQVSIISTEA